ncbi:ribosome maturation factor RimM [Desulfofundulus thermocisternus]|uniref:ribosome maturation factor RimM n=1 Tax=Desulfofundulus thermocisternus TaxID=42471 RepID=UPI0019F2D0AB|nr:ribosome maturation factor RimM [Desulfofundulus thermocisternus]MBE3586498.1 ribosome maturation factor RimM [Thermoanaerobacter sp.]MCS5697226.1 ribosome maturation factor RimM [Desulfofundulus thermocisternus]
MFPVVDFINIGKIVTTQGHRGEVRVLPLTDFPERFEQMDEVLIYHNGERKTYHIEKTWYHKSFVILKFREVQDMNAALALRGAFLQVTPDQLVDLPEDTYYVFEIIGLDVYTPEEDWLGKVTDVLATGANDVYVVEGEAGRPLLIPALKSVVRKVDLGKKRMVVELPPGLKD